jgi:hypothetical protein
MGKTNFTGFGTRARSCGMRLLCGCPPAAADTSRCNSAELAHKYGVDLYLCGHQHNYQVCGVTSQLPRHF